MPVELVRIYKVLRGTARTNVLTH